MNKFKYTLIFSLCFTVIISLITVVYAGEQRCLAVYERMTIEMENGASSASAGDACRAADGIERALNWLGTCEIECAYSKSRMQKIRQTKRDLTSALAKYVKLCGH